MDSAVPHSGRWSRRSLALTVCGALGVGALIGVGTFFGQGILPGQWNTLLNSGAIWLVAPFLTGARVSSRRVAAALGIIVLLATVVGYFVTAGMDGAPVSTWIMFFWLGVALVAGPLFGLAGRWWKDERRVLRVIGVALLGGVLLAEALYLMAALEYFWSGGVMLAAGLIAAALMARRDDLRLTLLTLPVPALATGLIYGPLNWLLQLRAV